MSFDFDNGPDRRGTDSQKWLRYAGRDVLPLWVADMDFRSSPAIVDALRRRVDHGVFGYARPLPSTVDAVVAGMEGRYGWKIDPAWILWLPGLVVGLNVTARAFAGPGEEVLALTPVYPPFLNAPNHQERASRPVPLRLVREARRWEIDWEALEAAVTERTRLAYFCHPHNPVGRVWRPEEVRRLGEFCVRRGLVLCSDEIHCDLAFADGHRHFPAALAGPEIAARSITLMAPSKTYNIPGLGVSIAIIPDARLRRHFQQAAAGIVAEVTALGYAACEAAYGRSEPWRLELIAYLRANRDYLAGFLAKELPAVRLEAPVEATYLAWLNVADLHLEHPQAHFEAHGVGLSDGAPFGARPGHYVRLNFGCPRGTLAEALRRMKRAVAERTG
ncbi:MAG: MalY/PatB family protein [Opitutaceae bacterium]